ncbi:hypothetical protein PV08_08992 [Exophiala spinifera]|uniref:Carboxylesterase type B domain-containing protein n=1 Tax=Exophiala spinifera TaxID=91928 RepID=A0A0D2B523_9EURO|nr:uncharacterized protein PV08_08992 [Exophiala spinifera]KIW13800.1 hypothetical protein PV08_08992 [Exophiala spinifera]
MQPTINLNSSKNITFRGALADGVESFLNIRFGEDTSSKNRFAAPKPYVYPDNLVVDASQPGAACPQQKVPFPTFPIFDNVTRISEDCLTLRVDRPANLSSFAKLPVMVFIYGGGDTVGQIYDSAYDPNGLVSRAHDIGSPVIYVAMNYRLGIFGFAASPALNAMGSLNVGLLDQRLALSWVSQHIAAFGGDPEKVTIFGESDGATGVGLQITAYGASSSVRLFQRAIMQSGGPTADTGTASNLSAVHTAQVVQLLNCTSSNSEMELSCLRELPMQAILSTAIAYEQTLNPDGGLDVFIPTSPSPFIPDSPSNLLKSGRFLHGIDIITGWNENDGSFFVPSTLASDSDLVEWLASAFPGLSPKNTQLVQTLYPASLFRNDTAENVSVQYFRASQMQRDAGYTCPSLLMLEANANFSATTTSNYLYALNQTVFSGSFAELNVSYYGVSHFSDIPYVFNQAATRYASQSSTSDIALSAKLSASWASFTAYGQLSKGKGTLQGWSEAVTLSSRSEGTYDLQVIGGPENILQSIGPSGTYDEHLLERCRFWNSDEVLAELMV